MLHEFELHDAFLGFWSCNLVFEFLFKLRCFLVLAISVISRVSPVTIFAAIVYTTEVMCMATLQFFMDSQLVPDCNTRRLTTLPFATLFCLQKYLLLFVAVAVPHPPFSGGKTASEEH